MNSELGCDQTLGRMNSELGCDQALGRMNSELGCDQALGRMNSELGRDKNCKNFLFHNITLASQGIVSKVGREKFLNFPSVRGTESLGNAVIQGIF